MPERPNITLRKGIHKNKNVIRIGFPFNVQMNDELRKNTTATWSKSMRCWYMPVEDFDLHLFFEHFKNFAFVDYSELKKPNPEPAEKKPARVVEYNHRIMIKLPNGYLEILEQKRYSDSTINMYVNYFKDFIHYFKKRDVESLNKNEINDYILFLIRQQKISPSRQNQVINAIKFYYEKVLGLPKEFYDIERPRKRFELPKVLSEQEVLRILKATTNLKHKALLATIYSSGLRRSELINLRKEDVDYDKYIIFIRGAKGKKDRISILSDANARMLVEYQKTIPAKILDV